MTITLNGTTGITTPALTNEGALAGTTGTFSGLITANGGQLKFPATQSASTDANTLDDYEEGTWTPSIGGTATYTVQTGKYTKIGNTVTVYFALTVNVIGTGSIYGIQNLPFQAVSGITQYGATGTFSSINTNLYYCYAYLDPSSTSCNFGGQSSLSASTGVPQPIFKNGAYISGQFTYFTNT